jgi:uncharacterized protein (TIGR03437 family)
VTIEGSPGTGVFATTLITPQLTLGATSLNVIFSGLVPGYVGLYQVNVQMPASLPSGASSQLALLDGGQTVTAQIALQ